MCECVEPRDDWLQVSSAPLPPSALCPLSGPGIRCRSRSHRGEASAWPGPGHRSAQESGEMSAQRFLTTDLPELHFASMNYLRGQSSIYGILGFVIAKKKLNSVFFDLNCLVTQDGVFLALLTSYDIKSLELWSKETDFNFFILTKYSDISKALNSIQNINELKVDQPICFLFRKKLLWKDTRFNKKYIQNQIPHKLNINTIKSRNSSYFVMPFCRDL